MEKFTKIEIGTFLRLFNRGGYVLDFSTNDLTILLWTVWALLFAANTICPRESR